MSDPVTTLNLSDNGDGMVPINPTTSFVRENEEPQIMKHEKNVSQNKETMDSTPISDIMIDNGNMMDAVTEYPAMTQQPRTQGIMPQMVAPNPQGGYQTQQKEETHNKNPFNLTDDQMTALLVGVCAAIAVSKPVQNKLVTSVPKFLDEQGSRSMVGLASTGLVAAAVFYLTRDYVVKD